MRVAMFCHRELKIVVTQTGSELQRIVEETHALLNINALVCHACVCTRNLVDGTRALRPSNPTRI
jgi:hypothetical protein